MPDRLTTPRAQLERELRREREQRVHNDDAKIGQREREESRSKDARESSDSSKLRRHR